MRHLLIIAMFLFFVPQESDAQEAVKDTVAKTPEVMPQFPGGQDALVKFLQTHIKYPREAIKKNFEGKVYVGFVVEKNGKLNQVEIRKGVNELLDQEAIRVVSSMPDWQPGFQKGKPVRVQFVLPISFKLK